jgi:hypothetical protein
MMSYGLNKLKFVKLLILFEMQVKKDIHISGEENGHLLFHVWI